MREKLERVANLEHENIVTYKRWSADGILETEDGSTERCAFIIMEVYQNGDMHNFLCPDDVSLNKYDPLHCKWLAAEMIKAVKFLHDNNLAHRDIKLDNFILSNEFKPMLIDFGQVEEYDGQLCE